MPRDGHPPGLDRAFGLYICVPCRAGDHTACRLYRRRPRLLFCECSGVARTSVLPCLTKEIHE